MTTSQPTSVSGFSIKESILWYVLLPLLLSIFISFLLILQIRVLLSSADDIMRSQAVISQAYHMQNTIHDMETGLRGYYSSGNHDFLEPYFQAASNLNKELAALNQAIAECRDHTPKSDDISTSLNVWLDYSKARIEQRKQSRLMPSDTYSGREKKMMSELRGRFEQIIASQQFANIRSAQLVKNNTQIALALTASLFILLSALLWFGLYRRIRSLANSLRGVLDDLTIAQNELQKVNFYLERTVEDRTISLRASNEELEAFCYSVSHELRAPLRGIGGFTLALAEDCSDKVDENGKRYISYIRQGVQRMDRLIDDLLNLSKITRTDLKKVRVNLTVLFNEVSQEILTSNQNEKVKDFSFDVDDDLHAFGDEGLLRVVIENLISNAWKFSKEQPNPQVSMGRFELPDGKTAFFISDNGVGFDMACKDKLFLAFQRLHSADQYSGTGIGLATVKRIIVKHGGNIWVESELGVGTTFFFSLPEGATGGNEQ